MSLMDEMKNVVTTARELFTTVTGKMSEIDEKVEEAVDGVPDEIRKLMGSTFYLDQSGGDDSNDGLSESTPVKSFQRIAAMSPAGASVQVRMMSDYVFDEIGENAAFTAAQLFIRSHYTDVTQRIKFYGRIRDGSYQGVGFSAYRNTLFNFLRVNLEMPDIPAGSGGSGYRTACISTHAGADVPTPLFLRMTDVEIIVPDASNNPFRITTGTGMIMISTSGVTAPQAWVDNGGMLSLTPSASQRVSGRVFHDGTALLPSA